MQLSVIIVNYNVRHFLEQCLFSVQKAVQNLQAEIIIVDNNSTDNSISYLQPVFPCVKFIANKSNAGFAGACNQGYQQSSGNYILFLNPDCIVPEDCFEKCIEFFSNHADAGAAGVRMLDGHGNFLKESKRAFPSPLTSLYKLFGLASLFPRSKIFARYHLGHLKENENHEVDVLAGAFIMMPKKVLEITGGFDETFFMYGEDVDLSYRIQQAGFKNYYIAETSIIHFKGESTKKGSLNYVRMFYKAMSIFVHKHYAGGKAGVFNFFIHLAIWARAAMSAVSRFLRWIGLPFIDALLIFYSFSFIKYIWQNYVRVNIIYPEQLLWIAIFCFTIIFLTVSYFAGLYDRWYKNSSLVKSTLIATVVLLAAYSLLPEQYRFSRGIVLFGAVLALLLIGFFRWLLIKQDVIEKGDEKYSHPYLLVAGTLVEYKTVLTMLDSAGSAKKVLGRLSVSPTDTTGIAYWKNIEELQRVAPSNEIIFCEGAISFKEIIQAVSKFPQATRIRFHASGSKSIVGSDSKDSTGESLGHENGFKLSDPYYKRIKRLLDVFVAIVFLALFPIHFILTKKPFPFLQNCLRVLTGKKTWVGYLTPDIRLPHLPPAIISSSGILTGVSRIPVAENLHMLDYWYARDYDPFIDLRIIVLHYRLMAS